MALCGGNQSEPRTRRATVLVDGVLGILRAVALDCLCTDELQDGQLISFRHVVIQLISGVLCQSFEFGFAVGLGGVVGVQSLGKGLAVLEEVLNIGPGLG